MEYGRLKRIGFQPGQMLGLTLIGILLLSALLYFKAVKAQRYMEPSLAIAQPRIEFAQNITRLIEREFGSKKINGIVFAANSIFIEDSLIFTDPVVREVPDPVFIKKLSRIFLSILRDARTKSQFDLILVSTSLPISPHTAMNRIKRIEMQHIAELIVDSLYIVEPELGEKYKKYFAPAAVPVTLSKSDRWIEFRIIPSEHLHIEMIKSLDKYYF